jgi:3'(2'), 5'-bisphosphate nucleotidase
MSADEDALVRTLVDLSQRAADLVRRAHDRGFEVSYKGPGDPVTSADREANTFICAELAKLFPDVPRVAEESPEHEYEEYTRAPQAFFVDPIDGTREFVAGSPEFVVMIGYAKAGQAEIGVVSAPLLHKTWFGKRNHGAYLLQQDHATAITTSSVTSLHQATLLVSPPSGDRVDPIVTSLRAGKVQSVGSAGLKGARVAEGAADVYASLGIAGKLWDACAIDALLNAAGGTLTDTSGKALDYRNAELRNDHGLLATNGPLLAQVIARLA